MGVVSVHRALFFAIVVLFGSDISLSLLSCVLVCFLLSCLRGFVSQAGDAEVKVEWRASHDERFGRGQEKAMNFSEFLGELEKGSELLYLTTQVMVKKGSERDADTMQSATHVTSMQLLALTKIMDGGKSSSQSHRVTLLVTVPLV